MRDFPGGSVVENLPCNAGVMGLIPGQGTKIPHATEQLSLRAATIEPRCSGAHAPKLESPCAYSEDLNDTIKTRHSQINE